MTMKKKNSRVRDSKLRRLEDCYLYAIASPADLAARLKSSVATLEQLAHDPNSYKVWTTETGRKIQEPKPALQRLHGRVHELLSRVEPPQYLHSSVRGRSYITNAQQHISSAPSVKLDLKKFFPSVIRHALFQFFYHRMRCERDVAGLLSRLLTYGERLATGSRASSILAYYCFSEMFDELHALAKQNGLALTCYVDDVTITGNGALRVLGKARGIVAAHGMGSHKIRSFLRGQPRIITGVVVTSTGIGLPNRRHLKIKEQYAALRLAQSDEEKLALLPSLASRVHEAAQIDPSFWAGKAKELTKLRRDLQAKAAPLKHRRRRIAAAPQRN
jgi:RNA-directed DNA polymerase